MKKRETIRLIAWMLAVACVLLFAAYALTAGAAQEHDCCGVNCIVCLCCHMREITRGLALMVAIGCAVLVRSEWVFHWVREITWVFSPMPSLVRLKVKLSD